MANVMRVHSELILWALEELSREDEQRRLWLSTGENGAAISSFAEAICQLFDDSGLSDELDWSWRQERGRAIKCA